MIAQIVVVAAVGLAADAGKVAPPAFPDFGKDDAILTERGTVVRGKIVERTGEVVKLKDAEQGGKERIFRRSAVVTFSFADEKARAGIKKKWGRTAASAAAWYELGKECGNLKLGVEAAICFEHAIALDPSHAKAHVALGHAEFEGQWLGRAEVRKKIAEGYVVGPDGKLVKKGETGKTTVKVEEKEKFPEHGRRFLVEPKRSAADLARFERERGRRAQDADDFKKQLDKEYLGVPWVNHHKINTKNYVIECNSTLEVARRYSDMMERLYAMLAKKFPPQRRGISGKSVVRIYRNGDDFRDQTHMFWGVGGFYMPSNGSLSAYHGTFGLTATTFNVLAHEGTHQFQGKVLASFENTPMWLIEGLAVYFGDGARIAPDGKFVSERIPRDRLLHIQEKIKAGRHEPLAKLVALDRRGFSGSHYADSWALIHFLVNSGKKGQDLLSAYWNIANQRKIEFKDFEDLAKIHSGNIAALEELYKKHVMALRPDAAGEIRGDYFYSNEFSFEIRKLGPEWKFFEDYRPSFLVGQSLPNTTAEVEVIFRNNDERAQSGDDYVEKYVRRYKDQVLPIRYSDIKAEKAKIHGADGFRFSYEDGGTGGSGAIDADDLIEEIMRRRGGTPAPDAKPGKPRRYVELLLVGFDGTFSVKASAEKEEFAKHEAAFDLLAEYFEPIYQRRW